MRSACSAASPTEREMAALGVLLTNPIDVYLEAELDKRFKLFRLWESPPERRTEFLQSHDQDICAIVGDSTVGANAELIEALPKLEIISTFSVGLDKIDLKKCRERGIRITNTPDVVTDDVADLAIGLAIAVLRKMWVADRYVRSGEWKARGNFAMASKVAGI